MVIKETETENKSDQFEPAVYKTKAASFKEVTRVLSQLKICIWFHTSFSGAPTCLVYFSLRFRKSYEIAISASVKILIFSCWISLPFQREALVVKETKLEHNGPCLALTCFYIRLQLLKFLSHSSQETVVQLMFSHF